MKEDGFIGRIEKRGDGYRFKVYDGYNADGTQNIKTKTWVPEPGMTPKQIEKECQRQYVMFEEDVKTGSFVSAKLTEQNFPNGFATTAELKSAGISGYRINQLCKNGEIVRIKHGMYKIKTLKISDKRDVILAAIPQGVFCMSEALYIHGFRKRKPYKHEIAVPRGFVHSNSRHINDIDLQIYYIKLEHFEIGKTVFKDGLPCYDLERTICDHFKNHTRISYRRLRELSKKYRDYNGKNIDLLKSYAEQLNLSVAAMQKMDWMILRHFRPKKKKSGKNKSKNTKNKSTPK